jgi:hypothetical protein
LGLPLTWRQRPVQLLALSVLGGMLGYALTVSREPRYLLPAIPMLALLACLGLRRLCRGRRGGWFGPASSALLLSSALPTLLATGFLPQLRPGEAMARVVEASYTRRPEPEGETAVSGPAAAGLAAVLGDDASGEGAYLLFAGDHQQMLAMELAPRAPRALFTTRQFDHLLFSPRNRAQQRRRRLLLVTDNLPRPYRLLWQTRLPGDHLRIYQLSSWREVLPALE